MKVNILIPFAYENEIASLESEDFQISIQYIKFVNGKKALTLFIVETTEENVLFLKIRYGNVPEFDIWL